MGTTSERALTESGRADPDSRARTHLANERTFLAWFRTGLGLILVGLGAAQFLDLDQGLLPGLRTVSDFASVLIVSGTLMAVIGGVRYARSRAQIDAARFQPAGGAIMVATIFIVIVGIMSLALVFLIIRP